MPYVGNIHAIDAINFSQRNSRLEPDISYSIVTRHPINRIESCVDRWIYECGEPGAEFIREMYLRESARIASEHPELLTGMDVTSLRDRLFINAFFATHASDIRELESDLPVFKLEDVTASPEALEAFFLHVFQGDEAVAARLAADSVNDRKRDSRSTITGTEAILASWSDWQCHAFNYVFGNDETRRRYQNAGYRVDFDRWQSRPSSS